MANKRELTPLQRLIQQATGNGHALGNYDDPMAKTCPRLWEWLSRIEVDDDHLKEPATLKLQLVPGGCQATLTDPTLGYSLDASANEIGRLFESLEAQLSSENPALRRWLRTDVVLKKKAKKAKTSD